mmetsp:Transcript_10513/g.10882  ORF Transcript_10513/g.10882 Transcript_10513/m.10882 type:complete len:336 (+) Transcript_10513:17-1024(+)
MKTFPLIAIVALTTLTFSVCSQESSSTEIDPKLLLNKLSPLSLSEDLTQEYSLDPDSDSDVDFNLNITLSTLEELRGMVYLIGHSPILPRTLSFSILFEANKENYRNFIGLYSAAKLRNVKNLILNRFLMTTEAVTELQFSTFGIESLTIGGTFNELVDLDLNDRLSSDDYNETLLKAKSMFSKIIVNSLSTDSLKNIHLKGIPLSNKALAEMGNTLSERSRDGTRVLNQKNVSYAFTHGTVSEHNLDGFHKFLRGACQNKYEFNFMRLSFANNKQLTSQHGLEIVKRLINNCGTFDLDGLVIDFEGQHFAYAEFVEIEALVRQYGVKIHGLDIF